MRIRRWNCSVWFLFHLPLLNVVCCVVESTGIFQYDSEGDKLFQQSMHDIICCSEPSGVLCGAGSGLVALICSYENQKRLLQCLVSDFICCKCGAGIRPNECSPDKTLRGRRIHKRKLYISS